MNGKHAAAQFTLAADGLVIVTTRCDLRVTRDRVVEQRDEKPTCDYCLNGGWLR